MLLVCIHLMAHNNDNNTRDSDLARILELQQQQSQIQRQYFANIGPLPVLPTPRGKVSSMAPIADSAYNNYTNNTIAQQTYTENHSNNTSINTNNHELYHNMTPAFVEVQQAQTLLSPPETRHNSGSIQTIDPSTSATAFPQMSQNYPSPYHSTGPPFLINPIVIPSADPHQPPKQFTEMDLQALKEILPAAETHKWKYISNKVSKAKAKKMNSEFCNVRFHDFFQLPYHLPEEESNIQYLNNSSSFYDANSETNIEGIVGTSLPYLVHKDTTYPH